MTDFKQKPIDDVDLINIIMMTRGRPEKLKRALTSLDDAAVMKDKIHLWAYVDDDDTPTLDLIDSGWDKNIGFQVNWHISSRPITQGAAFTEIWHVSSNAALYMGFNDDYFINTPDWDLAVRETFRNVPDDRIAIGSISDPLMPENDDNFLVFTAEWINQVGHVIIPYFPYWFGDTWTQQIAEMVDRKYKIPVSVWPMDGEKGKTHRLWDLPFWTRFFNNLLVERVETAEGIIDKLTSGDSGARGCAIGHMYKKIAEFIDTAEAGQLREELEATQSELTYETEVRDETYLTAFKQGEQHLKEMLPKIQAMNMQQILLKKKKIFSKKFSRKN